MTKTKRNKSAIPRRKAGLVINPPAPRPIEADHPALHFFKTGSGTPVPEPPKEPPSSLLNPKDSTLSRTEQHSGTPVPEHRSTGVNNKPSSQTDVPPSYAGPTQNFYRKTNHIADQVDRSLTPAESKILDHLVRLSIGFNKNTCQVRVSTLLARTGYRSDKTVRAALNGLVLKGMIKRLSHHNNPLGDEYLILSSSGTGVPEYRSTPVKNTAVLESKITGHLNTVIKDNIKIDDEADDPLAPLSSELRQAYRDLTGELPSMNETAKIRELAQLLVGELREAATRTPHVSSPAAFLATHLRRRLTQKETLVTEQEKSASYAQSMEPPREGDKRLLEQEISEHAVLLADLIANGYSQEQATKQFAEGFHPEDWKLITETALRNEKPSDDAIPPSNPVE